MSQPHPTKKASPKGKPATKPADVVKEETLLDDLISTEPTAAENAVEATPASDVVDAAPTTGDAVEPPPAKSKGIFSGIDLSPHEVAALKAEEENKASGSPAVDEKPTEPSVVDETDEAVDEAPARSYFDEDAQVVAQDSVLSEAKDGALLQQDGNVIAWELVGFYDEKGKQRNRWSLASDPPIFRMEDSLGESVEFALTKNLARQMARVFDNVNRGYYGMKEAPEKEVEARPKGLVPSIKWWIKSHTAAAGALGFVVALTALYLIATL